MGINFKKLCLAAAIPSVALSMSGCKDETNPVTPVEPPTGDLRLQKNQVVNDYESIVVMVNATAERKIHPVGGATGYSLHAKHQNFGDDKAYGAATFAESKFTVPARSVAVFVKGITVQ